MKMLSRSLVFILCFCLEVQTKANSSDSKHDRYHQVPASCLNATGECAFMSAHNSAGSILFESADLHFSKEALIVRISSNEIRVVKGNVAIRSIEELTVHTKYGSVHLKPNDLIFLEMGVKRINLTTLKGEVLVQLKGHGESVKLPQAYEFWYAGVLKSGTPLTGRVRPSLLNRLIEKWAQVESDKAFVRETLVNLYDDWKIAVMYSGQRDLASIYQLRAEDERRRKDLAKLRSQLEAENRVLRDLFYKKTFSE